MRLFSSYSSLTVMSSGAVEFPLNSGHAVTPLLYDILAIQHIYDANMSYRTGDDIYLLSADGTERAIWDAGGVDTLDLSGATVGALFALAEGTLIELGGNARAAIAFGVTIENAIGTPFSDFITGNAFPNSLEGGAGNDTLDGSEGSDTLAGGAGDDRYVSLDSDVVIENAGEGTDTWEIGASTVLPEHFENLKLTGGADLNATGNGVANVLTGNAGDNVLDGRGGADTLIGGAGDDTYFMDGGDVVIETGGGFDVAFSQASLFTVPVLESITLGARAGNGWILASPAADHFVGNAGNNLIQGGDGSDTLEGGRGDDTLLGGNGSDTLDGGRGTDVMEGGSGNDVYVVSGVRDQIVELAGGGSNDTVKVDAARFTLANEVENAIVTRTSGAIVTGNGLANRLDGGAGNDTFEGGAGADIFAFEQGSGGIDRILDFSSGVDTVLLDASGPGVVTYDAGSGALFYDSVQFATLGSGTVHPAIDLLGDVHIV